jgi:hypothetical protein
MDKSEEVAFLAEQFSLPPTRAAALVAEGEDETLELAALEVERQEHAGAYGDAPVPASPETDPVPNNGGLQKTVIGVGRGRVTR